VDFIELKRKIMRSILLILLIPITVNSDTTGNLLNQNFDSNAWSGTATGRHGSYEIAANHGQYLESTISLSNTLTEDQIKYGWTSTLGADIWHWNNATSETEMLQTITASDGTVTTQSRKVTISGCGYVNCGSHQTYTDSYTEGMNGNTDYDIKVRFNFSESTQLPYHWAVDLENPTLVIEYEPNPVFLSSTQTAEIKSVVDDVEEIKIKEYKFEEVKLDIKEEIKVEEIKFEEEIKLEEKEFIEETIVLSNEVIEEEVYEEEVVEETEGYTEVVESTGGTVETESTGVSESTQDDSRGIEITVEEISTKVAEKIKTIDGQLRATQMIVAKVMAKDDKISSYSQVNTDIFIQPELQSIDIGTYTNNTYVDIRNIYPNQTYEDRLWTSRQ
jgi:hypothetical protein